MPVSAHTSTPPALACNVGALDPVTRTDHFRWILDEMPRLVTEVRELPNGIALAFPAAQLASVATFVARERSCCPFLEFELDLPSGEEALWLRVTGPKGLKGFLFALLQLQG